MRTGTADVGLAVRRKPSLRFLGAVGLHNRDATEPKVGIRINESPRGFEAVATIVALVANELDKQQHCSGVEQNAPSRRLPKISAVELLEPGNCERPLAWSIYEIVFRISTPISN